MIDSGTIGNSPAAINLTSILNEIGDRRLIKRVTRLIQGIDHDLSILRGCHVTGRMREPQYFRFVEMVRKQYSDADLFKNMPDKVMTHTRCVIASRFNDFYRDHQASAKYDMFRQRYDPSWDAESADNRSHGVFYVLYWGEIQKATLEWLSAPYVKVHKLLRDKKGNIITFDSLGEILRRIIPKFQQWEEPES